MTGVSSSAVRRESDDSRREEIERIAGILTAVELTRRGGAHPHLGDKSSIRRFASDLYDAGLRVRQDTPCDRCQHSRSIHVAGPCRYGYRGVQCHCPDYTVRQDTPGLLDKEETMTDNDTLRAALRPILAERVMAAMEQPSMAGYNLPKHPSDLAHAVTDAILGLRIDFAALASDAGSQPVSSCIHEPGCVECKMDRQDTETRPATEDER